MMSTEIAAALTDALNDHVKEANFRVDVENWQGSHIIQLIDEVGVDAKPKGFKICGVRLGPDIFAAVGGATHGFENARMHNGIPLVWVRDFGYFEITLRPS